MDFWISMGFSVLFQMLKDKKAASQFRGALIKLFRTISAVMGDDAEFKKALEDVWNMRRF